MSFDTIVVVDWSGASSPSPVRPSKDAIWIAVARRGAALGMHILVCSRRGASEAARSVDAQVVSADDLLARSDVVSVHVRLTETTAGMFGAERFARMKRGAYFVNAARGGIVDEAALREALASGHLAGAALDVFAREPARADHPLLAFDNVLCTPHFAGDTTTTMVRAVETAVGQIAESLAGRRPRHLVNPEAWDRARARRGWQLR